jgi:hypothetical protein
MREREGPAPEACEAEGTGRGTAAGRLGPPHPSLSPRPAGGEGVFPCSAAGEVQNHSGIAFGFQRRSQVTISSLVTRIAENSDVNTPMLKVTANPFTGPEPNQ